MALIARVGAVRRGTGQQDNLNFALSSCSFTWSWGSQPASGALTYLPQPDTVKVVAGAWLEIDFPGLTFYGVVQDGPFNNPDGTTRPTVKSSGGNSVTLNFLDTRVYLAWDVVYGAFNLPEYRWEGGVRHKRYKHMTPQDWTLGRWSYTTAPLTAAQILEAFFRAGTVETPWWRIYHPAMSVPVYEVDAMSGRKLVDVVTEITERLGLVFTLDGGSAPNGQVAPFTLVWGRKGEGALPAFPANSDQQELGFVLSGAPTRVQVVGDRNRYLVLNLALQADWNALWEGFWNLDLLADDLFNRTPAYNAIAGDTEQAQGRQLAAARAREITVREYAQIRMAFDGRDFRDFRKFQGRSRMDMPAALYIRLVVFRAFRPPNFIQLGGASVPVDSLNLVDDLPAGVNYDPVSGRMTAVTGVDPSTFAAPGGNGFAVARGYQVGSEMFQAIRPERFNLNHFRDGARLWKPLSFQMDDSGVNGKFVLFDEPIVNPARLVTVVDGHAVFLANPSLIVPTVLACLTFEGPRFRELVGTARGKDELVQAPGLRGEYISDGAFLTEIPYADGKTASQKAVEIAEPWLNQPYWFYQGRYQLKLQDGEAVPRLTPMLDRVTIEVGPGGRVATVELTRERPPRFVKQLERDLDRAVQMAGLLPGQRELRAEANVMRVTAAAFRQDPSLSRQLGEMLHGKIGTRADLTPVLVADGANTLPVGTPLWKPAMAPQNGQATLTRAVMPAASSEATPHFVGVTVRDAESAQNTLRVQTSGEVLVRVRGPVEPEEMVCRANGQNYLVKAENDSKGMVGRALQAVPAGTTQLIGVMVGAGGGGSGGGGEFVAVWG